MDQLLVVLVEPLAAPHQQVMGNGADEALNHRQVHIVMREFKHLATGKKSRCASQKFCGIEISVSSGVQPGGGFSGGALAEV